ARGDTLFTQSWTPAAADPVRGIVVLLHGLNEHSGRYDHFAKLLNDQGLKVYAMDWIGHGGSDGAHGYVSSLDHAVGDLKEFLEDVVLEENYGLPCFLFGHSTGGAIVLKAALDPCVEVHIEGLILTSPAIHVQPSHPIIKVVAPIFSVLAPKYRVSALHKRGPPVSRDPEALKIKYADPLVYTGPIRVRTGNEILRISSYLQRNLSRVTVPFLVLHGTADTITDPRASQRLYQASMSTHKSIKLYDGYLHDLLFEPERDDIANDIITWLSSRLNALHRWVVLFTNLYLNYYQKISV
uniref:Serine aminopeptidase S33 domain-containing protein n=1 Tax=Aegilops tauschii subsp. strangulata TaxID=200361 RepID=A0A453KS76_AEGTS